jgi:hypothetical protein
MNPKFRILTVGTTLAIMLVATAARNEAAAAVCRVGAFWDAYPISVDYVTGTCITRFGDVVVISKY